MQFKFRFASKRLRRYLHKWFFLLICGMPVTGSSFLLGVNLAFSETKLFKTHKHNVIVEVITSNLDHPWGLAFLPDGSFLVTERGGTLNLISPKGKLKKIAGVPKVWAKGQGGLLDVAVDTAFTQNSTIYLTYSQSSDDGKKAGTALARAELSLLGKPKLRNVKVIFSQGNKTGSGVHFGSRIVLAPYNKLFITVGDRGDRRRAQDPFDHAGSTIRIYRDGSVPSDNPFADGKRGLPEIWSVGHRNPQGAIWNPVTNSLWTIAHGARGGDEVNHPEAGKNYGWPVISYGRNYRGSQIGEGTHKPGMEQPVYFWDPSIAPSGFAFYNGDAFPNWKGNLFVGALKYQLLARLELTNGKIKKEERIFTGVFGRIRDVRQGPEGFLYLLTDESPGRLIRVKPG